MDDQSISNSNLKSFKFLKKAENKMAFAKIGIYGSAGSGKTYTAAKLAVGLIHKYNLKPSVAMFDTEPAASFIQHLFDESNIDFYVMDESRALADLIGFMQEAEKECSVVIIDSVTHVWKDVQESYLKKINQNRRNKVTRLQFQDWGPIKNAFGRFTDLFLSSKVHAIVCGRAGSIYEYQTDERTGKKELITTGTKMASEKEMGYEPSLLIEMIADRSHDKNVKHKGIINQAFVQKDRTNTINGETFDFPTFKNFEPHFAKLNIGGSHFKSMNERDSSNMFEADGDTQWMREKKEREIWCEEIQGLLVKHFPSTSAKDKQLKMELIELVFQTRSWTKVQSMDSGVLKEKFQELETLIEARQSSHESL